MVLPLSTHSNYSAILCFFFKNKLQMSSCRTFDIVRSASSLLQGWYTKARPVPRHIWQKKTSGLRLDPRCFQILYSQRPRGCQLGQDMLRQCSDVNCKSLQNRMYRVIDFGRTKRDMWLSQNRDGSCRSKGAQDLTNSMHTTYQILQDERFSGIYKE